MATIQKRERKNGVRYTATVRRQGQQISKTFGTKKAAEEWAKKLEVDLASGDTVAFGENRTISEAIDFYLEEAENIPRGRDQQLELWRELIGNVKVARLSRAKLFDIRAKFRKEKAKRGPRLGEPLSPSTINRRFAALSAVYSVVISAGWVKNNPLSDHHGSAAKSKLKMREPRGRDRYLTDDEREALLEACKQSSEPALYPFVLAGITTGARAGELQALTWRDVRGNKATIQESKNGLARTVYLTPELLKAMKALPRPIDGGIFASARGTFPFDYVKSFADAKKAAGIENFRFHDTRHTAASYLAMSGATLLELQQILGHKTLAMVQRYAHLCDAHLETVHSRMAEKFLK